LRLVACSVCHTQYDVSRIAAERFACRCGEAIENQPLPAVDAVIARCGSCGAHVAADAKACSYCTSAIVRDPEKLSLICPECFARNSDPSRFCVACGVAFRPEAPPSAGRELPCPACKAPMPPSRVAGVDVNECSSCHGLWVAGDQFDALVRRAADVRGQRSATAEPPRVTRGDPSQQPMRYRRCPECDHFMLRINYQRSSGVILDQCRAHGTWLDADELEQVAGFILAGGRTSPTLEAEHQSADRAAAAAFVRARFEHRDYTRDRERPSLLRLLLDILHS
jgi:Zn-finger nucleic acid-binding protein